MGLSVSGTFQDIRPKLEDKNFIFIGKEERNPNVYDFYGSLSGRRLDLSVHVTPVTKQIYCIYYAIQYTNMADAMSGYLSMEEALSKKYGATPTVKGEEVNDPIVAKTWNMETQMVVLSLHPTGTCSIITMDRINGILNINEKSNK
jgi:hypothetical protein